jgi:hypothetical protein
MQELCGSAAEGTVPVKQQPALSGTLSRALCYLNSLSRRGMIGKAGGSTPIKPRILILQGSSDVQAQYIAFMNSIFSAQVCARLAWGIISCMSTSTITVSGVTHWV